jgi:hypothetical protein
MKSSLDSEKWIGLLALGASVGASITWLFHTTDSIYPWLALPVLCAALPLLAVGWRHRATVISAWLLLAYCTVTGFSIGILYWPSFMLMVAAAYAGAHARRTSVRSGS